MKFSRGALLVAVCLIAAFAVASAADAKPNRKLLGEKAADCYGWYCGGGGRGRNWNRGPWNRGWNGGFYPSWGGSYYPVYGGGWSQASASAQAGSFGGGFSSANAYASANAGGWGRR